jgi:hypothetical protein
MLNPGEHKCQMLSGDTLGFVPMPSSEGDPLES